MSKFKERKCHKCGKTMKIKVGNVQEVVCYKDKYYHKACFIEHAIKQSQRSGVRSDQWKYALQNIESYERIAAEKINERKPTDVLNDWILDNYDLAVTPSPRFWSTVESLGRGSYRNKRCKPVSVELLTEAWQWAQPNLNKIAVSNYTKGNKMEGESRLYYDLAIILSKLSIFLRQKESTKAAKKEMINNANFEDIDMSRIGGNNQIKSRKDISDIADDLFVE